MKAKQIFLGLAFFAVSLVATVGIVSNHAHHSNRHQVSIRKSAIIEVGAPLTVTQLKYYGFI